MTPTLILIQPPPPVASPKAAPDERRPLLALRLSDGRTWAHEFGASSHHELRDGCFEAWVACRMEWQRRADALPAHQTRKRASMLAAAPEMLQLHVRDTTAPGRGWLNANFGRDSTRLLVIRCPGAAPNAEAWDGADWPDAWRRCLRTWCAAAELTRFLANLGCALTRELRRHEERVAEASRRAGEDGAAGAANTA